MIEKVTELYRHYDMNGCLLYVGISINSCDRWLEHKNSKAKWMHLSVRMEIERFPTRMDALTAEYNAIINEHPIYNIRKSSPLKVGQRVWREQRFTESVTNPVYNQVLDAVRKITGKQRGAASWLAAQLGVSRQSIFNWSHNYRFPTEIVPSLSKITGIDEDDLTILRIRMPIDVWKQLCEGLPKSLINQAVVRK